MKINNKTADKNSSSRKSK